MNPHKAFIKDSPDFKILFENGVFIIGHVFEVAYSFNKFTKEGLKLFEFETGPSCALVGHNNDWCLVGGNALLFKTVNDHSITVIRELENIYDLKLMDAYTVQVLTDPWDEKAALWELSIDLDKTAQQLSLKRLRDFKEYIDQPYTDNIEW